MATGMLLEMSSISGKAYISSFFSSMPISRNNTLAACQLRYKYNFSYWQTVLINDS
jgi:hypothetical protein